MPIACDFFLKDLVFVTFSDLKIVSSEGQSQAEYSIIHNLFSSLKMSQPAGCDIWCDICEILWNLTITTKTFHNPFSCDHSGILRKYPTVINPRSPFVSMKDISKLSQNFENADLRPREEENGLWIRNARLGPTLTLKECLVSCFQSSVECQVSCVRCIYLSNNPRTTHYYTLSFENFLHYTLQDGEEK